MQQVSSPQPWNSLFDPDGVNYIFDYEMKQVVGVANSGGYVKFTVAGAYTEATIAVGDVLFIPDDEISVYSGFHTITEVISSTEFKTGTAWTGVGITFSAETMLRWVRLPEISVYAGALPGETYEEELPLTLLATFTPRNHPVLNQIVINVAGWLRSAFQDRVLTPPTLGEGTELDFNLFNYFRLSFDGGYHTRYFVAFSAIPTLQLNEEYVGTGKWLNELSPALQFTCGPTILQKIEFDGVYTVSYRDAELPGSDFVAEDFAIGDFAVNKQTF